MQAKPLSDFSDEELAKEAKKRKSNYWLACGMVGFMFGVAAYSTIRNGFGILTFIPVISIPMARPATKAWSEAKAECDARGLK